MYSSKSRDRLTAFAIVAIIILLAINAILLYNKYNQDKTISQQKEKLTEAMQVQSELEKEYYEALSELEEMRGDNEKLNSMIDQQKAELKSQRDRIQRLINVNQNLQTAKAELSVLKNTVDDYIEQIDQLQAENAVLIDANFRLEEERVLLSDAIATERQANDELKETTAELTEKTETLSEERLRLQAQVSKASAIKAGNIVTGGYKLGTDGKLRKRKKARNIELLQVCFDAEANVIAESGIETYHMVVIDPRGETMWIESLGSGAMTLSETGQSIRYTQKADFEYDKELKRVCMRWQPNIPFTAGTYQLELFNKGFLTGEAELEIK